MWEKIRAYLTFTRKERLGVLALLAIIVLLFIVPYFFRPETGSPDPRAYEKYKEGIDKFRSAAPGASAGKKDIPGRYADQPDASGDKMQNVPEKDIPPGKAGNKPDLFYFDPNRISAEDWRRLGLPGRLILTIEHYVQKGGSFRTAQDLKKLYGLRAEDYERLCPYVRIREPPAAFHEQQRRAAFTRKKDPESLSARLQERRKADEPEGVRDRLPSPGASYSGRRDFEIGFDRRTNPGDIHFADHSSKYISYSGKKPEDLDINQADSVRWCKLPGIGIKLASRIVRFRNKLGGFYEVDQVRETFGLPDSTFRLIRPYLHIGPAEPEKINLNDAKQEILQTHPYIRRKLAKEIIQYREQHGGFKSVAELQQLALMDEGEFKKLEPYLEVK